MSGSEQSTPPANVLVLASAQGEREDAACCELLTQRSPRRENVLFVSLSRAPDERLSIWQDRVGDGPPNETAIVVAGDSTRSAAASSADGIDAGGNALVVETVESPRNLTKLGVAITDVVSGWEEADEQVVVCFDSITTMLQYVDDDQAFAFLHPLTRLVRSVDGVAHYHVDPAAHDEQTIYVLRQLFDDVIDRRDGPTADRSHGAALHGDDPGPTAAGPSATPAGRFRTEITDGESPSQAVLRAVASVEGVDELDLGSPLHDAIEPDAVDDILTPAAGTGVRDVQVRFSYRGYRITVDPEAVLVERGGSGE